MHHLLRPLGGVEKWISEGWDLLNQRERLEVEERINDVFKDGFPFELKHDKVIYLYIFTLLSQLEIVALQLPLRALPQLKDPKRKQIMQQQLVDEVFHAMLFLKIAYELCTPYSTPPEHNQCIENICNFIRQEKIVGSAIVLLNLVAESWFEELLELLDENNVAQNVINIILTDERRHVQEAELYKEISLPSRIYLRKQISQLETQLISDLFLQEKYTTAMIHVLGKSGARMLIKRIYQKHNQQLSKLGIKPNKKWLTVMNMITAYLSQIEHHSQEDVFIPQSSTRKILSSAWKTPADPTMFSMLSLNVTRLETFESKYPPQTLTGLMLQAMSKLSDENPTLRNYISHHKLYHFSDNFIHLVIHLPGAVNHLAMLQFKEPHKMNLHELSQRVQNYIEIMAYARYKSEALAEKYPNLPESFYFATLPNPNDVFQDILFPNALFTLTNVGPWGGEQNLSPLLPFEVLKLTMSQVERKQVWNNLTKTFEIQDRLPIGLSADHRVFDGNMGTPKMLQIALDEMIDKLEQNAESASPNVAKPVDMNQFIELTDNMLENDLELGFRFLTASSHRWRSDLDLEALYQRIRSPELV